uniref:Uncharacterized protein n=2 Tax=Aegilops tauschii subsp. strangulata TaxID=200361 RepID=A0A453QRJ9_AEGTS
TLSVSPPIQRLSLTSHLSSLSHQPSLSPSPIQIAAASPSLSPRSRSVASPPFLLPLPYLSSRHRRRRPPSLTLHPNLPPAPSFSSSSAASRVSLPDPQSPSAPLLPCRRHLRCPILVTSGGNRRPLSGKIWRAPEPER